MVWITIDKNGVFPTYLLSLQKNLNTVDAQILINGNKTTK